MRRHLVPVALAFLTASCVPQAWRGWVPGLKFETKVAAPTFKKVSLPNGLTLFVNEQPRAPVTSVYVALAAGASTDPAGKEGLASLAESVAADGAGEFDTPTIQAAFDALGSPLFVSPGPDHSLYQMTVMPFAAPKALALISKVLREPRFDADTFQHDRQLARLDASTPIADPQRLGFQALADAIYGAGSVYARRVGGTPASLDRITLDDLRTWHHTWVGPNTTAIILTGRVTFRQAVKWTQQAFGSWKGKAKVPEPPKVRPAGKRTHVLVVPEPGLSQTVIVLGRRGVSPTSPDHYPLKIATGILGGRLFTQLREKEQISYGAESASVDRAASGLLLATSKVKAEATRKALDSAFDALGHTHSGLVPTNLLLSGRLSVIEGLLSGLDSTDGLAMAASRIFLDHRPLNAEVTDLRAIEHITSAQVRHAADTYLDPDTWQVILVGDPKIIKKQVGPMGLGPIELVDPNAALAAPAAPAKTASK